MAPLLTATVTLCFNEDLPVLCRSSIAAEKHTASSSASLLPARQDKHLICDPLSISVERSRRYRWRVHLIQVLGSDFSPGNQPLHLSGVSELLPGLSDKDKALPCSPLVTASHCIDNVRFQIASTFHLSRMRGASKRD